VGIKVFTIRITDEGYALSIQEREGKTRTIGDQG